MIARNSSLKHFASSHFRWTLFFLSLAACGDFKAAPDAFKSSKETSGPFSYSHVSQFDPENPEVKEESLDHYSVRIEFPEQLNKNLHVRRIDKTTDEARDFEHPEVVKVDGANTVFISDMIDLRGEKKTVREFEYIVYSDDVEISRKKISIKPTVFVKGTRTLEEVGLDAGEYTIDRFYFAEGAHLVTNGKSITLRVDKLVANAGVVETFTEQDALKPAPDETMGRSGGMIKIIATEGKGSLSFYMRGGKGGTGSKGDDSTGVGDRGADSRPDIPPNNNPFIRFPCMPLGGPATNGGTGPKGGTGRPGSPGGSSGFVDFRVMTESDPVISVSIAAIPGEPGNGGPGGKGGAGGPPGNGGTFSCVHGTYPAAAPGGEGPQGDTGSKGSLGVKDRSCVVIAPKTFCQGLDN